VVLLTCHPKLNICVYATRTVVCGTLVGVTHTSSTIGVTHRGSMRSVTHTSSGDINTNIEFEMAI
jgi:hypothetical protein